MKRFNAEGLRMTDCCGCYSTYVEETLCCKKCFREVGVGQGDGNERRVVAIQTEDDVKAFFKELNETLGPYSWHPDDRFVGEDATRLNDLMDDARQVCFKAGKNIHAIANLMV